MTNPPSSRPAARPPIRNIGFADLVHYRLPIPGLVSILHRISGLLLFLLLPLLLWLFDLSLSSDRSFDQLVAVCQGTLARLVLVALGWALLHHASAGVRFLLLDLHLGTDKPAARRSSVVVFAVSLPLALLFALFVFGVLG
jgi:succinate dehydrogenase / fumarate reductase cytochrome b subunit